MKAKFHRLIRKSHRYLGIVLGIQFLAWTLGGLYFSWTDIGHIRGERLRKAAVLIPAGADLAKPSVALKQLQEQQLADSVVSVQLIDILGELHYQIIYRSNGDNRCQLARATTGALRPALSRDEAVRLATNSLTMQAKILKVEHLTNTSRHHEYREKPLPAYAVTFSAPVNTTVYIASEMGTVQNFRNDPWRVFDFLWMLHTMDYKNRDDFNNTLLRLFSLFGVFTICSGYILFVVSSKRFR